MNLFSYCLFVNKKNEFHQLHPETQRLKAKPILHHIYIYIGISIIYILYKTLNICQQHQPQLNMHSQKKSPKLRRCQKFPPAWHPNFQFIQTAYSRVRGPCTKPNSLAPGVLAQCSISQNRLHFNRTPLGQLAIAVKHCGHVVDGSLFAVTER